MPISEIIQLTPSDADRCAELSRSVGWEPGLAAWKRQLSWGKDGCFGIEDGDRLVASTLTITYGQKRAWISMVITHPDYQRQGLASQLAESALDYLRNRYITEIGLDATP